MRQFWMGIALLIALCVPFVARAHHAAAGIDRSGSVTVEGTVTQFRWANPHSWIEMDVVDSEGVTQIWDLEMNPPSYLVRAGWTSKTIQPGDVITVVARPFINGDPGGIFVSMTLPNGEEFTQRAARGGRGN